MQEECNANAVFNPVVIFTYHKSADSYSSP